MSARRRALPDLALMLGAFAAATGLAEIFGAVNMGIALTFGELAFVAALLWIVLRG